MVPLTTLEAAMSGVHLHVSRAGWHPNLRSAVLLHFSAPAAVAGCAPAAPPSR
jgi:hypothetical protein